MTTPLLRIVGIHGSPYSRKLLAALRYRRLPYAWIVKDSPEDENLPRARVPLLPQLLAEDARGVAIAITDSTPILRDLDRRLPGRLVRPVDPVVALVDAILEDWADEWLTKPMFHYRWAFADDIARASDILPRWSRPSRPDEQVRTGGAMFAERQIGRLGVVGSNETTAPVIEESYRRTLTLLSDHLASQRFLLGGRPATCDFAAYGQLTQLTGFDPTPTAIAYELAPRVVAWVNVVEDLSGLEPSADDWTTRDTLPDTLRALLGEVGRVYVPFLLANADAIARGTGTVHCTIDGKAWTQSPFPYQARCLGWLREEYAALSPSDLADAAALLAGTGCEPLFAQ
ncbi:MAG: glutathione S-transferase N-terminal domain-containing protein [Candidatus Binatia bacterium]